MGSGRVDRRRATHVKSCRKDHKLYFADIFIGGLMPKGRSKSSAAELRRPHQPLQSGRLVDEMGNRESRREGQGQAKSKRGGKALRRIKTFLRREKKYVVVEGGQGSQRSRTRENFSEPTSAKIVGF